MTTINGSCFQYFSSCHKLSCLLFSESAIADQNLKFLGALSALRYLDLGQTGISDKGVKYLAQCHKLESLNVSSNRKITDASVSNLLEIKNPQGVKSWWHFDNRRRCGKAKRPGSDQVYTAIASLSQDSLKTIPGAVSSSKPSCQTRCTGPSTTRQRLYTPLCIKA